MSNLPARHVGDSKFESWFSEYSPTHKGTKQQMRDAYAAGMGDPGSVLSTVKPAARLMYRKKDGWCGNTVARTFEECSVNAYPKDWDEGPLLYTAIHVEREAADAMEVLRALDSGEWSIRRNPPCDSLTDEANLEHAWSVQREKAPYCTKDGHRVFSGPTAYDALRAGQVAFLDSQD